MCICIYVYICICIYILLQSASVKLHHHTRHELMRPLAIHLSPMLAIVFAVYA